MKELNFIVTIVKLIQIRKTIFKFIGYLFKKYSTLIGGKTQFKTANEKPGKVRVGDEKKQEDDGEGEDDTRGNPRKIARHLYVRLSQRRHLS